MEEFEVRAGMENQPEAELVLMACCHPVKPAYDWWQHAAYDNYDSYIQKGRGHDYE